MKVNYYINNVEHSIEIDYFRERNKLEELWTIADDVRIPNEEKFSNYWALNKAENEGLSYFVTGYCSEYVFKDPITRKLFREARIALNNLEKHLELNKGEEDED